MARYDLKKLRAAYKLTQKELADKLKITQGFLSSVEKWRNPFPDERIDDLQSVFPDADLSDYEVPEEKVKEMVENNNTASDLKINDPEVLKRVMSLASAAGVTMEKAREDAVRDAKYWRERFDEVDKEAKKLRTDNAELREEIWRLKELLLANGISYKKKDDTQ